MPRNINAPRAKLGFIRQVVGINQGGTNASNIPDAVTNLGAVPRSMIGQPNGLVPIDSNGKIPLSYFSENIVLGATVSTVDGPVAVSKSSVSDYTITNFDSFTAYNITGVKGTISNFNNVTGTFKFTANNEDTYGGFNINGVMYSVQIGNPI